MCKNNEESLQMARGGGGMCKEKRNKKTVWHCRLQLVGKTRSNKWLAERGRKRGGDRTTATAIECPCDNATGRNQSKLATVARKKS